MHPIPAVVTIRKSTSAVYHEYMLRFFDRNPWMWGTHVWNMFDFAADARDQGGEPG